MQGTEILLETERLLRVGREGGDHYSGVGDAMRAAAARLGGRWEDAERELLTRIPSVRVPNPKRPGKTLHPIDAWDQSTNRKRVLEVLRGEDASPY